ncbi:MAG: PRC-barrel domain-containing protein, partial [Actinomycetota bacterium]|nr:PRC-barrel domain-containing protein [Actinomycetota bacterium]
MEREHRSDRFTAIEDQYAGYEVYDRNGEKIGKVDDLFVDESDQPEYIGVKMGFLGTRSTLIPWEVARVDENDRRIEVSVDKAQAK